MKKSVKIMFSLAVLLLGTQSMAGGFGPLALICVAQNDVIYSVQIDGNAIIKDISQNLLESTTLNAGQFRVSQNGPNSFHFQSAVLDVSNCELDGVNDSNGGMSVSN